jgi:hypothetical protein
MVRPSRPFRFFRPEIEVTLKAIGVIALVSLIVLPTAWGYEQRRQARTWQTIACSYRLREITQQTQLVARDLAGAGDPCSTLRDLGFAPIEARLASLRR